MSPLRRCSSVMCARARVFSSGRVMASGSSIVRTTVFPFSFAVTSRRTVRRMVAAGAACSCGAPQVEATRPRKVASERWVRAKIVPPRIIQATVAQAKMKAMAMMRLSMRSRDKRGQGSDTESTLHYKVERRKAPGVTHALPATSYPRSVVPQRHQWVHAHRTPSRTEGRGECSDGERGRHANKHRRVERAHAEQKG